MNLTLSVPAPGLEPPKNVAFIGDYLPRQCGIATFTADLYQSYGRFRPEANAFVVSVNDTAEGYDYPDEVRYEFYQHDRASYHQAAGFLNSRNVEVVCLQHEYGIYGGPAGSYILDLLRDLSMPIVTTFHTILQSPDQDQLLVLKSIADLSSRVVCMSERGRQMLMHIYEIPAEKIDLIMHGIPDMPFVDPHFYKDKFSLEGKQTLLTFGLLSPNKGIETMIRALPGIVAQFPGVMYVVLGATHPHLIRHEGEAYREGLLRLADELGVAQNVRFYNQFAELDELLEFLGMTDIYVTPYLNAAQITSGTLAYSFGCGKAVVSTPYWHAEELLADGRGVLVPFNDADALAAAITGLLADEPLRHAMRKKAYLLGREMIWERAIGHYADAFGQARRERMSQISRELPFTRHGSGHGRAYALPTLNLDQLYRLSDSTGIIQHARHHLPFYDEGYCVDDNARALVLTLLVQEAGLLKTPAELARLSALTDTYTAFVNHAWNPEFRQFRNFMSYDRRWLESVGSEDSTGRTVWAVGTAIGRTTNPHALTWAVDLFEAVLPSLLSMTSPRTWAFALVGIHEYRKRFAHDRLANTIRQQLERRLLDRYCVTATPDWNWFESGLAYDNAKLPHALLLSDDATTRQLGLDTLRWLMTVQTAPQGHFQPIGSDGFYVRGQARAWFDQQPLEAQSTVSACLTAHALTADEYWHRQATTVFKWFSGLNDLGLPVYDPLTGGCCDGLHMDRVNRNQGAESTLSYLLALTELHLARQRIKKQPLKSIPTVAGQVEVLG
jgi:glycosyltransferase involved in cell wall biosynthesis